MVTAAVPSPARAVPTRYVFGEWSLPQRRSPAHARAVSFVYRTNVSRCWEKVAGTAPSPAEVQKTLKRRLASAAGHVKGIERMIDDDAYCIDVIRQLDAVQAALHKVSHILLDNHLRTCVTTAIQGDNLDERERMLEEVTQVFTMIKR